MLILKEALFLLLVFLDAEFTVRRIRTYGIAVELNPFVQWLAQKVGVVGGVYLGILIPTGALIGLGWFFPDILTFMLGVRTCLFLFQQRAQFDAK
jgi:hypothetical protein